MSRMHSMLWHYQAKSALLTYQMQLMWLALS